MQITLKRYPVSKPSTKKRNFMFNMYKYKILLKNKEILSAASLCLKMCTTKCNEDI